MRRSRSISLGLQFGTQPPVAAIRAYVVGARALRLDSFMVIDHFQNIAGRGAPERGRDLQLRWVTTHPLDDVTAERIARGLRARARFSSTRLDVRRTVDRSVRAGLRLTPCFVEHKRTPEYLALIEHQGARDVLAAHHAAVVDQLRAHDVSIRRLGLQPRSQLVIDPARGRRPFEGLQPASERERLLIFARDGSLRDPLTDRPRRWLARLDRWSWTIQVAPDAALETGQDRRLRIADHVVDDVRCLDPMWARGERGDHAAARPVIPAMFEDDAELWLEPHPPSEPQLKLAYEVLPKALGNAGWYWLGACASYPEITYELTVALGRLLHDERGEPVAHSVDVEVLARLPWFRHAFMPDWLRSTLQGSLSDGQLAEVKEALEEILVSGLLPADTATPTLQVAPGVRGPAAGRGEQADTDRRPGPSGDLASAPQPDRRGGTQVVDGGDATATAAGRGRRQAEGGAIPAGATHAREQQRAGGRLGHGLDGRGDRSDDPCGT